MKRKKPTKRAKRKSTKLLQQVDRRFGWALMIGVVGLVVVFGYLAVKSSFAGTNVMRHFVQNVDGVANQRKTQALGFNLVDVGLDAKAINALPAEQQAMVWVGNTKCGAFDVPFDAFTAAVDKLGHNPKVYGWYLSDGPNAVSCPKIVSDIKRRADYIHAHAPGQKAYIAAATDYAYAPLKPSLSHADVFGVDPYPCRTGQACNFGLIDSEVAKAAAAGIPREAMAPIYQLFGQACAADAKNWRLPTEGEVKAMLARWDKVLPHASMDVAYSWNRQSTYVCQALTDANGTKGYPDLQSILKDHNVVRASQPVVTAPPATKTPVPAAATPVPVTTATPRVTPDAGRPSPRPILEPTPSPTTPPHVGDSAAPTKPGNFRAAVVIDRFAVLLWEPSSDNRKVQGYRLYRNGTLASDQHSSMYIEVNLKSSTSYTYEVEAYDAAGNVSPRAQLKVVSKVASAAATAAPSTPVPSSAPATQQPLGITPSGVDQPVEIPPGVEPDVTGTLDVTAPGPDDNPITVNDGGAGPDEILAADPTVGDGTGDENLTDAQINGGQGALEGDVSSADISADEATVDTQVDVEVDGGMASADGALDTTYLTNGAHEVSVTTTKADGTKKQATRTVKVQNTLTPLETARNQIFAGFHGNKQLVNNTMTGLAALLALLLIGVSSWAIRRWVMGGKRFGKVNVL